MTEAQAVREGWPGAAIERESSAVGAWWSVWTAPLDQVHGVRQPGDVASVRGLLGLGSSPAEAWAAARRQLALRGEIRQ